MTAHITIRLPGHRLPIRIGVTEDAREAIVRYAQASGDGLISRWALARLDAARDGATYDEAAAIAGMTLHTWVRVVLYEAAGVTGLWGQLGRV